MLLLAEGAAARVGVDDIVVVEGKRNLLHGAPALKVRLATQRDGKGERASNEGRNQ